MKGAVEIPAGLWYLDAIKLGHFFAQNGPKVIKENRRQQRSPGFARLHYAPRCLFANSDKRRAFASFVIHPPRGKKKREIN